MKLNLKSFIVGFVIACVLLMSFSVFASDGMSYLGVFKDASAVFINNVRVAGTNFLWNEKTYVAIEDVATALGLNYSKIDGNISVAGVVPTGVTAIVPTPTPEPSIEPLVEGLLEEEQTPTPEVTPEPTPEITPEVTPAPTVVCYFVIENNLIVDNGKKYEANLTESEIVVPLATYNKLRKINLPATFQMDEEGNIINIKSTLIQYYYVEITGDKIYSKGNRSKPFVEGEFEGTNFVEITEEIYEQIQLPSYYEMDESGHITSVTPVNP